MWTRLNVPSTGNQCKCDDDWLAALCSLFMGGALCGHVDLNHGFLRWFVRCNAASASESASESENSVVRLDDLQCYWAREEEPRIYSPWPYTTACADVPMVTELFALRRPMPYCLRGSQYTHVGVDLPYRICIFNILLSFVHVAQTELNWPSRPTYTMLK